MLYEKAIDGKVLDFSATSDNFRFSAAVAEFGLVLRDSEFKGNASIEDMLKMARGAKGADSEGYRAEFIKLAETAEELIDMRAEK
jgi:Ca-activated chloride channel family protein